MKNIIQVGGSALLAVAFMFGVGKPVPVLAATEQFVPLTETARAELLQDLLQQLQQLQEVLEALKTKEATNQPAPQNNPKISPVTAADYTRGSANADKQIVVFTDFDCPFCLIFHSTINSLLAKRTDVAFSYRHFPIEPLHPNAFTIAVAAECAGQIGGDEAFWKFTDAVFTPRGFTESTDLTKLNSYARDAGISVTEFTKCRRSKAAKTAVRNDAEEGVAGGVEGTPTSFVFVGGEERVTIINGAQPLSALEKALDQM